MTKHDDVRDREDPTAHGIGAADGDVDGGRGRPSAHYGGGEPTNDLAAGLADQLITSGELPEKNAG